MTKLQTMPLKFRAWDTMGKEMHHFHLLSDKFMSIFRSDPDRFIISQGTGLVDRKGEHVFTGDLVSVANGKKPLFIISYEEGEIILRFRDGGFGGRAIIVNDDLEVVGNIWEENK